MEIFWLTLCIPIILTALLTNFCVKKIFVYSFFLCFFYFTYLFLSLLVLDVLHETILIRINIDNININICHSLFYALANQHSMINSTVV